MGAVATSFFELPDANDADSKLLLRSDALPGRRSDARSEACGLVLWENSCHAVSIVLYSQSCVMQGRAPTSEQSSLQLWVTLLSSRQTLWTPINASRQATCANLT